MITRKSEVLIYLGKAASITAADEALLDLVHPLAESAIRSYMQKELQYQLTTEFLPIGQPQTDDEFPLSDIQFRAGGAGAHFVNGRAGTEFLQLKNTPVVTTDLQVFEDVGGYAGQASGAFGSDTELTIGSDFFLDLDDGTNSLSHTGILYRVGAWPAEPRSIKVLYYGGWSASQLANDGLAGAVKLAALKTVSAYYWSAKHQASNSGQGPVMAESIGKYSRRFGTMFIASAGVANQELPPDAKALLQPYRNLGRIFG